MAVDRLPTLRLILCGDKAVVEHHLNKLNASAHPRISFVHTTEVVNMCEKPSVAIRGKKDSSMRKAIDLVKEGKADACVSAGNTGALFGIAHFVLKTLPGVERPALISSLPTRSNDHNVFMLDLGANVFCDANVLYQFGIMALLWQKKLMVLLNPKLHYLIWVRKILKAVII